MSDDDDSPSSTEEAQMLGRLADMFTEDGDLLPTTEEEVARLEAELEDEDVSVELPPGLEELSFEESDATGSADATGAEVTELGDYRKTRQEGRSRTSPWTHAVALFVGAAAALVLKVNVGQTPSGGPAMSSDPVTAPSSSAPDPTPGEVKLSAMCEGCCAGRSCQEATAELASCASGNACIGCDQEALFDSRYRIRVSAVTPAPLGVKVLGEFPQGEPELCFRAGVSQEVCSATRVTASGGGWTFAPGVFSGTDLASKLTIRLRWKGVSDQRKATAGSWTMPVAVTPKALCSGYSVQLEVVPLDKKPGADKERFGSLSLFLDDTHYVELMRAQGTAPLRDLRERLTLDGLKVKLFETREAGDRRFALVAGPFHRKTANTVRWQALQQELPAAVALGLDYVGDPLPLP